MKKTPRTPRLPRDDETPAAGAPTGVPGNCPLRADSRRALGLGEDLAAALRRLRRRQKTCLKTCRLAAEGVWAAGDGRPGAEDGAKATGGCELLRGYDRAIRAVMATVLDEWNTQQSRD